MAQVVIRYNVHLPLGSGGSRIGSFRSLDEARQAVASESRKDLQIWKTIYHKGSNGKLYCYGSQCVK